MSKTTDNNATYNFEDTFENNLFKITGPFVPDNMGEEQTMRFQNEIESNDIAKSMPIICDQWYT